MKEQKDMLIVLSGGLDSTTLLYEYKERIAMAITFDYGSKHNASEIFFAQEHTKKMGIEHLIIPLQFINTYFKSDLLQSGGAIPQGEYSQDNMKSTVVPFRNGIMLSIAAGIAESNDLSSILIANHFGDHQIYPDCRSSFIEPMSQAIGQGTSNNIQLLAPYTDINKEDIVRKGLVLGIDYSRTWSCYEGGEQQCGVCATCLERKGSFTKIGAKDPTVYKE